MTGFQLTDIYSAVTLECQNADRIYGTLPKTWNFFHHVSISCVWGPCTKYARAWSLTSFAPQQPRFWRPLHDPLDRELPDVLAHHVIPDGDGAAAALRQETRHQHRAIPASARVRRLRVHVPTYMTQRKGLLFTYTYPPTWHRERGYYTHTRTHLHDTEKGVIIHIHVPTYMTQRKGLLYTYTYPPTWHRERGYYSHTRTHLHDTEKGVIIHIHVPTYMTQRKGLLYTYTYPPTWHRERGYYTHTRTQLHDTDKGVIIHIHVPSYMTQRKGLLYTYTYPPIPHRERVYTRTQLHDRKGLLLLQVYDCVNVMLVCVNIENIKNI